MADQRESDSADASSELSDVRSARDLALALARRQAVVGVTRPQLVAAVGDHVVDDLDGGYVPGDLSTYLHLIHVLGIVKPRATNEWAARYIRVLEGPRGQIAALGDNRGVQVGENSNVTVNQFNSYGPARFRRRPMSTRQIFFFGFLRASLFQSNFTFLLSMLFTAAGAIVVLFGAVLALRHVGEADYRGLITSGAGAVVTTCGGAFAVQAHKARKAVTEQADRVREEINKDNDFRWATAQIDKIDDPQLRDYLRAIAAQKKLGMAPSPVKQDEQLRWARLQALETKPDSKL
ncbi:hypothetical protein [Nocardia sp. NPDC005825]|uniref:TRADD-N-associated membrane domain-containing protein n=1 Tax=unclassified Nocardia TaxID=2637762 RepID=UPI0033F29F73